MNPERDDATSDADGGERDRRRIDAVLDDGYLDGIEDAPIETLRRMRDACREEEDVVSYARRLVQGKLDMLHAEVRRRRESGTASDRLDELPEVLADPGSPPSDHEMRARAVTMHVPGPPELRRVGERAGNFEPLGDLETIDDATLAKRFGRLAVEEERLSDVRSRLLRCIDALNDEIAQRYRDGEADVQDVLRS